MFIRLLNRLKLKRFPGVWHLLLPYNSYLQPLILVVYNIMLNYGVVNSFSQLLGPWIIDILDHLLESAIDLNPG